MTPQVPLGPQRYPLPFWRASSTPLRGGHEVTHSWTLALGFWSENTRLPTGAQDKHAAPSSCRLMLSLALQALGPGPAVSRLVHFPPQPAHGARPRHLPYLSIRFQTPETSAAHQLCARGGDLAALSLTPRCPPALVESSRSFYTRGHFIRMVLKVSLPLLSVWQTAPAISRWKAPQRESGRVCEGLMQGGDGVRAWNSKARLQPPARRSPDR